MKLIRTIQADDTTITNEGRMYATNGQYNLNSLKSKNNPIEIAKHTKLTLKSARSECVQYLNKTHEL